MARVITTMSNDRYRQDTKTAKIYLYKYKFLLRAGIEQANRAYFMTTHSAQNTHGAVVYIELKQLDYM